MPFLVAPKVARGARMIAVRFLPMLPFIMPVAVPFVSDRSCCHLLNSY